MRGGSSLWVHLFNVRNYLATSFAFPSEQEKGGSVEPLWIPEDSHMVQNLQPPLQLFLGGGFTPSTLFVGQRLEVQTPTPKSFKECYKIWGTWYVLRGFIDFFSRWLYSCELKYEVQRLVVVSARFCTIILQLLLSSM